MGNETDPNDNSIIEANAVANGAVCPSNRRRLSAPGLWTFIAIADLWELNDEERLPKSLFSQCPRELIGERLHQIVESCPLARGDVGLYRHPRQQWLLEPAEFVCGNPDPS